MAKATTISAEVRDRVGKGAARAMRRAGRVPAVIYGDKKDAIPVSLDPRDLIQQLVTQGFFSRVFEVKVGKDKHRVLARDVQFDPLTDRPLHVDFMRFSAGTMLNVDVELAFENEELCPGIKKGGIINVVRHTIELNCAADNIPNSIIIDVGELDMGDSVQLKDIVFPKGAQPTATDPEMTVVTIAAPTAIREEALAAEEEAAAAALMEGEEVEEEAEAETE